MLSVIKALFWDFEKCVISFQVEIDNMEIYLEKLKFKSGKEKENLPRSAFNFWCALASVEVEDENHEAYSERLKNFIASKIGNRNIQSSRKNTTSISLKKLLYAQSTPPKGNSDSSQEHIPLQNISSRSNQLQRSPSEVSSVQNEGIAEDSHHRISVTSLERSLTNETGLFDVGCEKESIVCSCTGNETHHKASEQAQSLIKVGDKENSSQLDSIKIEEIDYEQHKPVKNITLPPLMLPSSSTRNSTVLILSDSDDDSVNSSFQSVDSIQNHDGPKYLVIEQDGDDVEIIEHNTTSDFKPPPFKRKPHLGIKYKFEMKRLILRDLRVHAQDFLNATHSENDASKVIKLNHISMDYKQLNSNIDNKDKNKINENKSLRKESSEKKNELEKKTDIRKDIEEGSYCDEIINRIKEHVMYEVLYKNKLSLASNIFGAAANHTVSMVR